MKKNDLYKIKNLGFNYVHNSQNKKELRFMILLKRDVTFKEQFKNPKSLLYSFI